MAAMLGMIGTVSRRTRAGFEAALAMHEDYQGRVMSRGQARLHFTEFEVLILRSVSAMRLGEAPARVLWLCLDGCASDLIASLAGAGVLLVEAEGELFLTRPIDAEVQRA